MERLTVRDITGCPFCQSAGYLELLEKLASYEDAEEQGRLVILPEKLYGFYEWDVTGVRYYDGEITAYCVKNERVEFIIYASEIGKTVFLTREEAEAALKGETR